MRKSLSPLRYPGGKAQISEIIADIIVKNNLSGAVLLEPFCGGCGAGLNLIFSDVVSKLVMNDADFGVASFWNLVLNDTENICDKITNTEITFAEWKQQKQILRSTKNKKEAGFATLFLNRCNRSGILSGGCIGGVKQKGNWKIDARFNKANIIQKILKIAELKDKIYIYNHDIFQFWQDVAIPLSENAPVIAYLDPPYWKQGKALYKEYFNEEQHIQLSELLKETNIPFILSYDNADEIKELYKFANVADLGFTYSVTKSRKEKELLILPKNMSY